MVGSGIISMSNFTGPARTIVNTSNGPLATSLKLKTTHPEAAIIEAEDGSDVNHFRVTPSDLTGPKGQKVPFGNILFHNNLYSSRTLRVVDELDRLNDAHNYGTVTSTVPPSSGSISGMFDGNDQTFTTWSANANPTISVDLDDKGESTIAAGAGIVVISFRFNEPTGSVNVTFTGSNGSQTVQANNSFEGDIYTATLPASTPGSVNTSLIEVSFSSTSLSSITEIDYVTDQGFGTNKYGYGRSITSYRSARWNNSSNSNIVKIDPTDVSFPFFAAIGQFDRIRDFNASIGGANQVMTNNSSTRLDWIDPGEMFVTNPTGGTNNLQSTLNDINSSGGGGGGSFNGDFAGVKGINLAEGTLATDASTYGQLLNVSSEEQTFTLQNDFVQNQSSTFETVNDLSPNLQPGEKYTFEVVLIHQGNANSDSRFKINIPAGGNVYFAPNNGAVGSSSLTEGSDVQLPTDVTGVTRISIFKGVVISTGNGILDLTYKRQDDDPPLTVDTRLLAGSSITISRATN